MRRIIALAGMLAGALLFGSYFSPYLAMYQMKKAIQEKDAVAFSEYVDFPALRESLKAQMMAFMQQGMPSVERQGNSFADLGQMLGAAMIGPLVDAMVSPVGIIAMMGMEDVPKVLAPSADGGTKAPPNMRKRESYGFSISYKGWNKVVASRPGLTENNPSFIFTRQGLWSWKMTSIALPANFSNPAR